MFTLEDEGKEQREKTVDRKERNRKYPSVDEFLEVDRRDDRLVAPADKAADDEIRYDDRELLSKEDPGCESVFFLGFFHVRFPNVFDKNNYDEK